MRTQIKEAADLVLDAVKFEAVKCATVQDLRDYFEYLKAEIEGFEKQVLHK